MYKLYSVKNLLQIVKINMQLLEQCYLRKVNIS